MNPIMKNSCFIYLTLVVGGFAQDLSNLGPSIEKAVREGLAPLNNLGYRITQRVQDGLNLKSNVIPGRTYGSSHNMYGNQYMNRPAYMYGHEGLTELDGLGETIAGGVEDHLKPLDNLGEQIEQSVYQGLEPVRALQVTLQMKNGVGGTTIVTYQPGGKKFIVRNYKVMKCDGEIDDNTGQCSGQVEPFYNKEQKDICYVRSGYSLVNDYICVGANSVSIINNNIICRKSDGSPAVLMKASEFRKLCQGDADTAVYKYIADQKDPAHVPIPNPNRYVVCENPGQPGVCVFREKLPFPGTGSVGRSNGFYGSSDIVVN